MDRSCPPFYFPTNVVLLDDDTNFLRHFSLLLDPQLPCRPFSSATAALEQMNTQASLLHSFTELANITMSDDAEDHTYLDLNKVHQLIYQPERFSQITVAIIDYDMPEMNGIEVCEKINHPEIKKILLTGKADEKLAVEAFNSGLIHQFIQKSNDNVDNHVNRAVEKLQLEYFLEVASSVPITLTNGTASFLADREFNRNVRKSIGDNKIVEFYICENPRGLLMLDSAGNANFMFAISEDVLNTHYDMALASQAPEELLKLLKDKSYIPWFPPDGFYSGDSQPDWQNHLYKVDFSCGNNEQNFYSLATSVPLEMIDVSRIVPFETYLKTFDEKYSQLP